MVYSPVTAAFEPTPSNPSSSQPKVFSLAALWAKNYVVSVKSRQNKNELNSDANGVDLSSKEGRQRTAKQLLDNLTLGSAQAWSKTETLLSEEIRRHGIDPTLINPWEIAADSHDLFQRALNAYSDCVTPSRLSVLVINDFGRVRQKYTAQDPRAIGFVSMQFHYTGQMLLDWVSADERQLLVPYFKVMDDHLYMPLRAAYDAAAKHDYHSPALQAVRHLLPLSTKIAQDVCQYICRQHPHYTSYSGSLNSPVVQLSSVRDVEMFQVYLCLCVLEDSIQAVKQELFPLCVMLYPRLGVSWQLIQGMLQVIGHEMVDYLPSEAVATFLPYLRTLTEMFSSEVFTTS